MALGTQNAPTSPTDKRLAQYSDRAIKALQAALGHGQHEIARVQSRAGQMYRFTLPGDQRGGQGRLLVTPNGEVKIWHQTMLRPWVAHPACAPIEIGGDRGRGPLPGYAIALKDFESLPADLLATARQRPLDAERHAQAANHLRRQFSDDEVHALALHSLAGQGWDARRSSGGVTYLQDGQGSSAAGRLVVHEGVAMCWSFRGEIQLDSPWRLGRPIKGGLACMYATGRDLAGIGLSVMPPVVQRSQSQQSSEHEKIASIQAAWARILERALPCPAQHRHLVKGAANPDKALPAEGLVVVVSEGKFDGAVAVPMLRETDKPGQLQVVGVQALLPASGVEGNDKQLLVNSSISGSFTPWPLPPMRDGKFDLQAWVDARDKTKPIVLCEGVATALAVHHSGAGHAVICYSSSNLPLVAKYFSAREFDAVHGIVVAADNDIGLKRDGSLKSTAVAKALEAARECGGEVAFLGRSAAVGADARDLFVSGGAPAVQSYIDRAAKPDEVAQRFERVVQERRSALNPSMER